LDIQTPPAESLFKATGPPFSLFLSFESLLYIMTGFPLDTFFYIKNIKNNTVLDVYDGATAVGTLRDMNVSDERNELMADCVLNRKMPTLSCGLR
jgi:hypothetical protein